ncbi:MAG: antitoxin family protein [Planctomycetota bacterium]
MNATVNAIYEHGLLRPMAPLSLPDGARVELIIIVEETAQETAQETARVLAEIAALPLHQTTRTFFGREHDQILYGSKGSK